MNLLHLDVRLARRLARDRAKWVAAVPVLVATLLVTAAFSVLQMLGVTPEQAVERDLGRYGASAGFGTVAAPPGSDVAEVLQRRLVAAGHDDAFVTYSVVGVRDDAESVVVRQGDWSREPMPGRYALLAGSWPDEPGEMVVAAGATPTPHQVGDRLSLLSGRVPVKVVGIARDRWATSRDTMLWGPGTWAAAPADTTVAFPAVAAYPVVFWSGRAERQVTQVVAKTLAREPGADLSPVELQQLVATSMLRLPDVMASGTESVTDGNPLAYQIPSVAVTLVGAVVFLGLVRASLSRNRRQLAEQGLRAGRAALVPVLATLPPLALAVATGAASATLLALASRPLLTGLHPAPLAPPELPVDPLVRVTAVLALVLATTVAWSWSQQRRPRAAQTQTQTQGSSPRSAATEVRRWSAVVVTVAFLVVLRVTGSPTSAMILATLSVLVAVLVSPDVLDLVLTRRRRRSLGQQLVARQLRSTSAGGSPTLALTAAVVGLSIAFTVLLSTMIATVDDRQVPAALPGQVVLADRGSPVLPVPAPSARVLESSPAPATAVVVPLSFATRGIEGEPGARVVRLDGQPGYVMAVASVQEARALLGGLDASAASTLREGGVLAWTSQRHQTETATSRRPARLTTSGTAGVVDVAAVDRPRPRAEWALGRSGLVLTATLRQLGLPVSRGAVVIASAPTDLASQWRELLSDAGMDPDVVTAYSPPPPAIPHAGLVATAAMLALVSVVLTGVTAGARVRALSPVAGQLVANGVSPAWARRVLLHQEALLVGTGSGLGAVAGLLPVLLAVPRFGDDWVLQVPWGQAAVLVAATIGSSMAVAVATSRHLVPRWDA